MKKTPKARARDLLMEKYGLRGHHHSNIWLLYSSKMDSDFAFVGDLEYLHAALKEMDGNTVQYQPHPPKVIVRVGHDDHATEFDMIAEPASGPRLAIEVKPLGEEENPQDIRTIHQREAQILAAERLGAIRTVVTEKQIDAREQLWRNGIRIMAWISAARDHPMEEWESAAAVRLSGCEALTIRDFKRDISDEEWPLLLAGLFRLYVRGLCRSNLESRPLSLSSLFWSPDRELQPGGHSAQSGLCVTDTRAAGLSVGGIPSMHTGRSAPAALGMPEFTAADSDDLAISRLPRYTRRNIPPQLANYRLWRSVDLDSLDRPTRRRVRRFQRAIKLYLEWHELKRICEVFAISAKSLITQLNRCITLAPDGKPIGWPALVAYAHCNPYRRSAPSDFSKFGRGYAGEFSRLLVLHPSVAQKVKAWLLALPTSDTPIEKKKRNNKLYALFLTWCAKDGVSAADYPLRIPLLARRSLFRFAEEIRRRNWSRSLRASGFTEAAARLRVGGSDPPRLLAVAPFDAVQIDAHRLHCKCTLAIKTRHGTTYVPIERLTAIFVADVFSQAFLGYSVVIRREPRAVDILLAKRAALGKWQPRSLTIPGLRYKPGAGLPSGVIPELCGVAWAQEQIDNALANIARSAVETGRERIGGSMNLGAFGSWDRRPIIERMNEKFEQYGLGRIVSSTGTSSADKSVGDANAEAVRFRVELEEVLDIIDVVIANLNAEPNVGLSGKSALDVLRDFCAAQDTEFLPRTLPPLASGQADLGTHVVHCRVRGNEKQGRRPYVQHELRYTNAVLQSSPHLIGQLLTLHVDSDNMQSAKAFLPNRRELGALRAKGPWGRAKVSLEEIRHIKSLIAAGELKLEDDVVGNYHEYLERKAREAAERQRDKRPKTSAVATKVAEIQQGGRWRPSSSKQPRPTTSKLPLRRFQAVVKPRGPSEGNT